LVNTDILADNDIVSGTRAFRRVLLVVGFVEMVLIGLGMELLGHLHSHRKNTMRVSWGVKTPRRGFLGVIPLAISSLVLSGPFLLSMIMMIFIFYSKELLLVLALLFNF